MLRIAFCVCIALILSGCQKNWRGFVVEKRIYRDGYYVHIPWKRYTPELAYPKPEPYPVDHSRAAATDSTQKNAGGVAGSGEQASGNATNNVSGNNPTYSRGTNPPAGGGGSGDPPDSPPVAASAAPAENPANAASNPASLDSIPEAPEPPLVRPEYATTTPSDSVVAATPPPSDTADAGGINFPEGELSMIAELGFYNPVYTTGIEINPFSYNAGASFRYSVRMWPRHKLSADGGVFASHVFIKQDQHKYSPLFTTRHSGERLLQFKARFLLLDHIYCTRKEDAKFDAVEIGVFSDIGLFSTHVAIDNMGHNDAALYTRSKTRLFGLHYLRTAQYGMTVRIANELWSVFANYRFNSLVKADPDGGDLPKLVIGTTFAFGE